MHTVSTTRIAFLLTTFTMVGGMTSAPGLASGSGRRLLVERPSVQEGQRYIERDCNRCPEMVSVPRGELKMGSTEDPQESPVHTVEIQPFEIGVSEVTWVQFRAGAGRDLEGCSTEPSPVSLDNLTAVCVSWDDAMRYVAWLRAVTGRDYRLPTEAEWEYVARHAAEFGVSGMAGENAWEWVEDCWHPDYRGAPTDGRAWIDGGGCAQRVLRVGSPVVRGSSWQRPVTVRLGRPGGARDAANGFRVARSLPAQDRALADRPEK